MKNIVRVVLNGVSYSGLINVYVRRALDTLSGAFKIETAIDTTANYPIKLKQTIQIFLNEEQVLDGYVEKISTRYEAKKGTTSHVVVVEGRDKTCDVIDSTLDGQITFSGTVTLESIIKTTLSKVGITGIGVINNVSDLTPFPSDYLVSASVGETVFSFFNNLASLKNVILTTDGKGNIVITRALSTNSNASLINTKSEGNKSNIENATVSYDDTGRFNKYVAFSQAQNSLRKYESDNVEDIVNIRAEVTDDSIRAGRVYNFLCEQNSSEQEAKQRATWERNLRYGPSSVYDCTVTGFNATANTIWKPNELVQITDEFADINSLMLIDVVEFLQDDTTGSVTKLKCIDKDAFTAQLKISQKEQESKIQGQDFGARERYS